MRSLIVKSPALKALARATLDDAGEVDGMAAAFVFARLSRPQLKEYLFRFRQELARRRVSVWVSGEADARVRDALRRGFAGKQMIVSGDETLGGGVRIRAGDDLIDASVKGYLRETIDRLKKK